MECWNKKYAEDIVIIYSEVFNGKERLSSFCAFCNIWHVIIRYNVVYFEYSGLVLIMHVHTYTRYKIQFFFL